MSELSIQPLTGVLKSYLIVCISSHVASLSFLKGTLHSFCLSSASFHSFANTTQVFSYWLFVPLYLGDYKCVSSLKSVLEVGFAIFTHVFRDILKLCYCHLSKILLPKVALIRKYNSCCETLLFNVNDGVLIAQTPFTMFNI